MAAYVLAQLEVHDPETFQRYREKVAPLVEAFGGRYIVRGGEVTPLEGELAAPRLVILEFADREAAKRWYFSGEYQDILPLRLRSATGSAVIVDGI
ncbi:MAG: DUF1330 domain-containing protein [Rhizobiales bacterium]|nr:DUF1330 domain-containing protein [Hyphomicrobiales bacterium]